MMREAAVLNPSTGNATEIHLVIMCPSEFPFPTLRLSQGHAAVYPRCRSRLQFVCIPPSILWPT
jgi:hypothetical protein